MTDKPAKECPTSRAEQIYACPKCGHKETAQTWTYALACPKCGLYAEGIAPEVPRANDPPMSWYPG